MIQISGTMIIALVLLIIQGVLGAFDTVYYHEIVSKLPSNPEATTELKLHALRSFIYGIIFIVIAWYQVLGYLLIILVILLVAEIIITLMDFVEEDTFRTLEKGERISHAIMGIIYGGFLAFFIPELIHWWNESTGIQAVSYGIYSWFLSLMSIGVTLSAIRDAIAGFWGKDILSGII